MVDKYDMEKLPPALLLPEFAYSTHAATKFSLGKKMYSIVQTLTYFSSY